LTGSDRGGLAGACRLTPNLPANIPAALRDEAATQVAVSGSESFWALADELTAPVRV
jgi:hypothetical protein